jgi:ABC-type transport system substrate-binding protein
MATQNYRFLPLIFMGVIMTSCTKNEATTNLELKIHFPAVKLNVDPQRMEDAFSMAIATQLYRGLLRYNMTGDIRADLAESWTESEDHRIFRFKLKKATFSDGTAITSKHIQMTFARLFRLGSSMAADIDYIAGARQFKETLDLSKFGVRPVSDNEVEFRLAEPSAIFLKQLAVADCAILPLSDFRKDPDVSAKGAFSGPFKITSDLKGQRLTIEKWRTDILDSTQPPKKIQYSMIPGKPVELALTNETDTLDHYRVDADERIQLEKKGWAQAATELAGEIFIVLDPKRIPLELRKALYSSVDPAEILETLGQKSYRPAYGLIPFGLAGELSSTDVTNLKNTAKSLTHAKNFVIDLDFEGISTMEEHTAQFLKKKWAPFGVELRLHPLSKGEKLNRLFGKGSQAILARKAMDYPDGFSVLGYFKGNYESNYFYVNDKKIDAALATVIQIFDGEKRAAEYKRIQNDILAHYTIIPLFFGSEASGLWNNRVKSVPSHPLGIHTLPLESVEMSAD